jgi:2,6-dihydroxypyridine 3-monooxygenase
VRYLERDGSIAHELPCQYRFTSYYALYRILLDALGPDSYHLGFEFTGFDLHEDHVLAGFADGGSARCDLLVCADGVGSTARRLLLPDVTPQYAGYVGWRGTAVDVDGSHAFEALGDAITHSVMPQSQILAYPIPSVSGSSPTAQRPMNWVCTGTSRPAAIWKI